MRELTDGRGVNCVVEIGGPGTIAMSLKALAVGGHVSLIGARLSESGTGLDPSLLLTGRDITLGAISVGSRADFETLNRGTALQPREDLLGADLGAALVQRIGFACGKVDRSFEQRTRGVERHLISGSW